MSINDANGNLHSDTDGRFTEKSGTRPAGPLPKSGTDPETSRRAVTARIDERAARAKLRAEAAITEEHIRQVCDEAGLGVMVGVFDVLADREQVSDDWLRSLSADDVAQMYEAFIAPAIDRMEAGL